RGGVRRRKARNRLPYRGELFGFRMLLHARRTPPGFIGPCLPCPAERPPTGPGWIHEIKHDGFRIMVRRDAAGVRLLTRNGIDWSARFPLIFEAAGALQGRSFLLDGEAVACDGDGLPVFDRLRSHQQLQEPRVARSLDGFRREWFKVHCDGGRLGWPHHAPFRRRSVRTFAGFRSPETSSMTRPGLAYRRRWAGRCWLLRIRRATDVMGRASGICTRRPGF